MITGNTREVLDFGAVSATENIRTLTSDYPYHLPVNIVLIICLTGLLLFCLWVILKKSDDENALSNKFKLSHLPVSAKASATLVLLAYGLVHFFSVLTVYLKTKVTYTSAEEYFHYMPVHRLSALSHAHFFGHATLYGLMAILFLFTSLSERKKRIIILMAPVGALLDNAAWWGMKLVSPSYEILSYVSAVLMMLGFSVMALMLCVHLWRSDNA